MSSPQVELYRSAKRILARDPSLTDEQAGELCGLPRHVLAGWTISGIDRAHGVIRSSSDYSMHSISYRTLGRVACAAREASQRRSKGS